MQAVEFIRTREDFAGNFIVLLGPEDVKIATGRVFSSFYVTGFLNTDSPEADRGWSVVDIVDVIRVALVTPAKVALAASIFTETSIDVATGF